MYKIDLKKQYAALYKASASKPQFVNVPVLPFVMIDGTGDPNSQPFQEATNALYSAAYTLKFAFKKGREVDFPVMALEGLWRVDDLSNFSYTEREGWRWTIMIMMPEVVTADDFAGAVAEAGRRKPNPALARLRLEHFEEGRAAQIMHIGPYAAEPPTIEALHAYVQAEGCQMRGKHHEIYLSDPRRTAPEKMKTILRQPVDCPPAG